MSAIESSADWARTSARIQKTLPDVEKLPPHQVIGVHFCAAADDCHPQTIRRAMHDRKLRYFRVGPLMKTTVRDFLKYRAARRGQ